MRRLSIVFLASGRFLARVFSRLLQRRSESALPAHPEPASCVREDSACLPKALSDVRNVPLDADLRELLLDRLHQVVEEPCGELAWACCVTDALDELQALESSYAAENRQMIRALALVLRFWLEAEGGELLDEDAWNPALQRAEQDEPCLPPGSPRRISEKISPGLRWRGKLIRKQTVRIQSEHQ